MTEEYDPLSRMGQGNAYDGLFLSRFNWMTKFQWRPVALLATLVGILVILLVLIAWAEAPRKEQERRREALDRQWKEHLHRGADDGGLIPEFVGPPEELKGALKQQ